MSDRLFASSVVQGTHATQRCGSARERDLNSSQRPSRYLLLLREGCAEHASRILWNFAAVRIGVAGDGAGAPDPLPSEGVVFPSLDAGLISIDPDQVAALRMRQGAYLVSMEAERRIDAREGAIGHGPSASDPCPRMSHRGPFDEALDTWGLQATRVSLSRFTGRGVRVAILDSGLDFQHPDFKERPIVSESFVNGDSVTDTNGHGTYCAGVACGPISPWRGPRYGVASGADLYIGKIVDETGSGADGNMLGGIDWAMRRGCAVVSLSVGTAVAPGEPYSPIFEHVAARALAAGTLIVGAAGNTSLRPDCIAAVDHPANCPSIVAVSAVDSHLQIAPFSCGSVDKDGVVVDLAAPGVAVRSAWLRPALYRTHSGTSMASPYVAGIAALMVEADPSLRGRTLRQRLRQATLPLALPDRDVGAGLVQAP